MVAVDYSCRKQQSNTTDMENKITHDEYQKAWFALHEGIITEEEWREFCDILFVQILDENKDVMVRLKNR